MNHELRDNIPVIRGLEASVSDSASAVELLAFVHHGTE